MEKEVDLNDSLNIIASCSEPYDWSTQQNIISSEEAWNTCENSEWLIYLLSRISFEREKLDNLVCQIIIEYISSEIVKEKVKIFFETQKLCVSGTESKEKINDFFINSSLERNINLAIISCARILFKNNSKILVIIPFSDERDIYLAPFKYLEKNGISKKDLSVKIKEKISFKDINEAIAKYKQTKIT